MVVTGGSGKFKLRSVVKRYPWPPVKPYNLSEVRTYRFESGTVWVVKYIGRFPSGQRGMTVNHLLRLRKFESSSPNILRIGS